MASSVAGARVRTCRCDHQRLVTTEVRSSSARTTCETVDMTDQAIDQRPKVELVFNKGE